MAATNVPILVMRAGDDTVYELEGRTLRVVFESIRESHAAFASANLRALAAAGLVDRVTLRMTTAVKRVGDELVGGGRYGRLPLGPLFRAAQESGVPLELPLMTGEPPAAAV